MREPGATIPRTKLVCTIGPASVGALDELVASGMSVARVNLAHGSEEERATTVRGVRAAAERAGRDVALLADLPGPKLRGGAVAEGEAILETGRSFRIGPREAGDATGITANHDLSADLAPGDLVLLADGAVELRVTAIEDDTVETLVERGGTFRSRAGIAVPAERLSLPALTAADRAALPSLVQLGVDFVGQSFVRAAGDVEALRAALRELAPGGGPSIVAKIETRPAVEDAQAILRASDAIMVARGDLGVELPFEDVPLIQKQLIRTALEHERPVIVATQMLESMTEAPRPTRAEVSDVANAALDGADAVMLSAETAIGRFPVEAAEAAIRILAAVDGAEAAGPTAATPPGTGLAGDARAVALGAIELASKDPDVALLACFTRTGRTAALLAALRPRVPIAAFSPNEGVRRRLALVHGVRPLPIPPVEGSAIGGALDDAVRELHLPSGSVAVLVATTAGGGAGPNLVEVLRPDTT